MHVACQALGQTASPALEAHSKGWVPLFLQYSSARSEGTLSLDEPAGEAVEDEDDTSSAPASSSKPMKVMATLAAWPVALARQMEMLPQAIANQTGDESPGLLTDVTWPPSKEYMCKRF